MPPSKHRLIHVDDCTRSAHTIVLDWINQSVHSVSVPTQLGTNHHLTNPRPPLHLTHQELLRLNHSRLSLLSQTPNLLNLYSPVVPIHFLMILLLPPQRQRHQQRDPLKTEEELIHLDQELIHLRQLDDQSSLYQFIQKKSINKIILHLLLWEFRIGSFLCRLRR